MINKSETPYGTFYAVSQWSGNTIEYVTFNNNAGNSIVLDSIAYK